MNITSAAFVMFVAVIVPLYHLCPLRYRVGYLLAASHLFYCTWSVPFALVLFLITTCTFLAARRLEAGTDAPSRARTVTLVVLLLVFYLALFKYGLGLAQPLQPILSRWGLAADGERLSALVPLGISYYTFKLISYVVDVYWGKMPAATRFAPFAAFVAFFPQIVAGPIQRADDFLPQAGSLGDPPPAMLVSGLRRLLLGFFKKLVVADNLAVFVDYVFAAPQSLTGAPLLLGAYLFAFQLYVDFSALTDIAIGLGRLFGIRSPENFNAPFLAANIADFWRRWHMTLTSWLTDYVFTPLRMQLRHAGNLGLAVSLAINMVLIGIWHGPSWNYVLFGVIHAVCLIVYTLTLRSRSRFFRAHPEWASVAKLVGPMVTFHLVVGSFVFFRASTVADALHIVTHCFQGLGSAAGDLVALIQTGTVKRLLPALAGLALVALIELLRLRGGLGRVLVATPRWGRWAFYYAVILAILALRPAAQQFIYFRF